MLRDALVVSPLLGFEDNLLNVGVLDDGADVDRVVHLFEDLRLLHVLQLEVVQQLQPQVLQLVRVVFEQFEVVAHGGQDLVKLRLMVSVRLRHEAHLLLCWLILRLTRSRRLFDLVDQSVPRRVVL